MKKISLLLTLLVIFNFTHHANSNEESVNNNAGQTSVETENLDSTSNHTIIDIVHRLAQVQVAVTANCINFLRKVL